MFGVKKVIVCLNNISNQIQELSNAIEELKKRIDALEVRVGALEKRLDAVETRLDTMDEKIDMVEYHLSKEIQVTYQTALENKKGIEVLSNHFEEGKRYMVGESHKIAELSVRFDEFQKRCVGA